MKAIIEVEWSGEGLMAVDLIEKAADTLMGGLLAEDGVVDPSISIELQGVRFGISRSDD